MTETAIVVQKAYDWNLWILPKVEKFPKSHRFSVSQNLVATSLDLLMNLVDATYQSKNSGTLAAAVRNVNRARYLVRLSKDLRLLNVSGYEFAAQGLGEIGRMARRRNHPGLRIANPECPVLSGYLHAGKQFPLQRA